MTIREIIKYKDIDTHERLQKMYSKKKGKHKEIKLGDSIKNLMKANSYIREGRRVRQIKWG